MIVYLQDEEWEKKIETYVQPTRKSSTDLSDKMRLKLASFEENKSAKPETATRVIQPDNSFRDKLKAFKNIETSAGETSMLRRDSEPSLVSKLPGYKSYRNNIILDIGQKSFLHVMEMNLIFLNFEIFCYVPLHNNICQ